jgi:hypothetical protein
MMQRRMGLRAAARGCAQVACRRLKLCDIPEVAALP